MKQIELTKFINKNVVVLVRYGFKRKWKKHKATKEN